MDMRLRYLTTSQKTAATPRQRPAGSERRARYPSGSVGAAGEPFTPLSGAEAAAAVSICGSLTAPEPSRGWTRRESPPSRSRPWPATPRQSLPETRPRIRDRTARHRWDSALDSQPPENTAPVLLPLASHFPWREILLIHRIIELSITAAPSGKCSPE